MQTSPTMNSALVCLLLVALQPGVNAVYLDKTSQNLRQPAYENEKAKEEESNIPEVVKIEEKLREHQKKVMNVIDKFRAQVCAEMKDEFGVSFKTFAACHKFMKKACKPGKDMKMDGDGHEVSTGEGFCKQYFPEAEKKAEEEVAKEEEEAAAGPSPGPYPGPSPAPAPAPAPKAGAEEEAPAPAPKTTAVAPAPAGEAPSPGPAGSPGPAPGPVPAPFIPGKSSGKPWGPIPKDEAWYYKGDKDDMSRMHMSEDKRLPVQGYWGKLVEHEDMQTAVGDWQREFGPKSGLSSVAEACRKHPDSPWCIRKGFGRNHRASAPALVYSVPLILALLTASMY